ncbi:hypothetical protein Golax_018557 [Gossypium laxum]|uniref:RNase H type-1 domain-containing protein n=1 Tax=Gossypium laxum TaxID=34288 RepID=A0A7J8Z5E1_9ROSI|nr:hypothetical protein [Gossypium laxum]
MFGGALWAIWLDRNKTVNEKQTKTGRKIANDLLCCLVEIDKSELDGPTRMSANDQWIPTHGELIEVNFDEAFDKDCLQSCSRRVARNAGGWVLVSRTILHENVASAFAVEALACSWAVQTSMEMGWPDLIFEGDSLSVVNKCRINSLNKSEIGAYIRNIQQISKKFRKEQTYMEGGVSRFGRRRMEDD